MMPGSTWIILTDGISARLARGCLQRGFATVRTLGSPCTPAAAMARPEACRNHAVARSPALRGESPARAQSRLAAQIAAAANDAAVRSPVAGLMLVAPGRLLRMVEDGLDPSLRRRIVARIARNLTAVPDVTLRWHLAACLAIR